MESKKQNQEKNTAILKCILSLEKQIQKQLKERNEESGYIKFFDDDMSRGVGVINIAHTIREEKVGELLFKPHFLESFIVPKIIYTEEVIGGYGEFVPSDAQCIKAIKIIKGVKTI